MQEPEFVGGDVDLRINIYRSYVDTPNGENDAKSLSLIHISEPTRH